MAFDESVLRAKPLNGSVADRAGPLPGANSCYSQNYSGSPTFRAPSSPYVARKGCAAATTPATSLSYSPLPAEPRRWRAWP